MAKKQLGNKHFNLYGFTTQVYELPTSTEADPKWSFAVIFDARGTTHRRIASWETRDLAVEYATVHLPAKCASRKRAGIDPWFPFAIRQLDKQTQLPISIQLFKQDEPLDDGMPI